MKFKFKDKVIVTSPEYAYIAEVGTVGEIVGEGHTTSDGGERYLVLWESTPTMIWGAHDSCIEALNHSRGEETV